MLRCAAVRGLRWRLGFFFLWLAVAFGLQCRSLVAEASALGLALALLCVQLWFWRLCIVATARVQHDAPRVGPQGVRAFVPWPFVPSRPREPPTRERGRGSERDGGGREGGRGREGERERARESESESESESEREREGGRERERSVARDGASGGWCAVVGCVIPRGRRQV